MRTKNWWPYGIILTFVIFITCTVSLVVFACTQKTELVSENYYDQEIRFQSHMDRQQRAQAEGAAVSYGAATGTICISIPKGARAPGTKGTVHLYRPSAATLDQHLPLTLDSQGTQTLDTSKLRTGLWKVRVDWSAGEQGYFLEQTIIVAARAS